MLATVLVAQAYGRKGLPAAISSLNTASQYTYWFDPQTQQLVRQPTGRTPNSSQGFQPATELSPTAHYTGHHGLDQAQAQAQARQAQVHPNYGLQHPATWTTQQHYAQPQNANFFPPVARQGHAQQENQVQVARAPALPSRRNRDTEVATTRAPSRYHPILPRPPSSGDRPDALEPARRVDARQQARRNAQHTTPLAIRQTVARRTYEDFARESQAPATSLPARRPLRRLMPAPPRREQTPPAPRIPPREPTPAPQPVARQDTRRPPDLIDTPVRQALENGVTRREPIPSSGRVQQQSVPASDPTPEKLSFFLYMQPRQQPTPDPTPSETPAATTPSDEPPPAARPNSHTEQRLWEVEYMTQLVNEADEIAQAQAAAWDEERLERLLRDEVDGGSEEEK
ncbi:hypothetical protein N0V83_000792 [Neocucurbitaria cava]|uniref:Uncharacterized protein n=1 Tax=Neocucurbitaria cava TaxID=798079 RepID=A0A9W9CSC7_9PLEO|nr:hypothetical protein N0V83_000792 [Neocucurbitaria cava]